MEKRDLKEYGVTSIWKEEDDDILFWTYALNTEMDLEVAKKVVQSRLEYSNNAPMYAMIDISGLKSATNEAREYMNDKEAGLKSILGGAFISRSVVATVLINLYLQIKRPAVPARFFTKKEDALNWLRELKNKRN